MALGEKIVRELELTDGVDTLGKWMAHHLASVVNAANDSDDPQSPKSREAVELILKLWEHKNSLPGTADPMKSLKRAMGVLERIGPDSSPFYRHSQIERERALANLFDGLRQLVAHGVLLLADQKEIPEYTTETFEYLSEEERQFIIGMSGWMHFLEQRKPTVPALRVVYAEEEEARAAEAAKLESLEPDERSRVLFSQAVDEIIENLQNFKARINDPVKPKA